MKLFLLTMIFSTGLLAETVQMVQVDKTFMGNITDEQAKNAFEDPSIEDEHKVEKLNLKKGDKLTFKNRDEVSHNVSAWKGEKALFDVKLQDPGQKNDRTIELTESGEFTVQCAIHPKMKIKLKVD